MKVAWASVRECHTTFGLIAKHRALITEPVTTGAACRTIPIVVEVTYKEPLLAVVLAWIEDVGEQQAVVLGGLLALRDALRADLAAPPDPPVGGEHARS